MVTDSKYRGWKITSAEQLQAEHYDRIAVDYAAYYNDEWSQKYRHKFINEPLFAGIDLAGANVLEVMCGSGGITDFLLANQAEVTGLDISEKELRIFREKYPDCKTICASILNTKIENETFDCVVVVGGLHHLHPNLSAAIEEMIRILKPAGLFCFAEPHKGSFFDVLRRQWYKRDVLFAENEEGIGFQTMKREFGHLFKFKMEKYGGNIAYLLVYNSMVFRVPLRLKKIYSPLILWTESLIEKLQSRRTSCMVIARWQKR